MSLQQRAATAALIPILAVLLLVGPTSAVLAQDPSAATAGGEDPAATSKKDQKEAAREARIAEYLRKREERRARKQDDAGRREADAAAQTNVPSAAAQPVDAAGPSRSSRAARSRPRETALPRDVQRMQDELRLMPIGQAVSVQTLMDRIERGEADGNELAALGNFLSDAGLNREALAYYELALGLDDSDPLLWNNVGTIHRKIGDKGRAISAFSRALNLDGNYARAHYNLGAALDEKGDYEGAIAEYRLALTLDPALGNPEINPQAGNNPRLVAVKLMLYRESIGSLGLPLAAPPGGAIDAAAGPDR